MLTCGLSWRWTEDNPAIRPYLEDKWAELPDSKSAPIDVSLDLLESIHKRWVLVLRNMSPADFKAYLLSSGNKSDPLT
jgi:hypothetical protein